MDNFTKIYRETYDNALFEHGFKRKGRNYYRLVNNQVLHTISPQISSDPLGSSVLMNYGVWALCGKFHKDLVRCCGIRSDDFPVQDGQKEVWFDYPDIQRTAWFGYEKEDCTAMKWAAVGTLDLTMKKILPLFDQVVDYKGYWDMVTERREKGLTFSAQDSGDMWVPIALKRYEDAKKRVDKGVEILKENIRYLIDYNETFKKKRNFKPVEVDTHHEILDIQKALETGDYTYLDGLVKRNEERSMDIIRNEMKLKV